MKQKLLRLLPAILIRAAGRLQFQFPALKKPINLIGQFLAGDGIIPRGAGKGLYFNAEGCNPGYLAGTSEPLEQELLVKYTPRGGVVYDLGANAGFYAIIAADKVGPNGCVYAFEPTPTLAKRIRGNAARNSFDNLHVVEAAVTATDGQVSFCIIGPLSVNNAVRTNQPASAVTVNSIRLDTFCADHRPPDLIMIDIEGGELDALEGGLRMISQHHPVMMVEVHWLGQKFTEFFERALKPLGYTATTYQGKPLPSNNTRYHALLIPGHSESP